MQNAKDSFYEELRNRLVKLNPERTVLVGGVTRPGVLIDENETGSTAALPDCFHLQWTDTSIAIDGDLPLVTQLCAIRYATAGSAMNSGLDRGRALAAMDGELLCALEQQPQNAAKANYCALAHGGAVAAMTTRVWWSAPVFEMATMKADRVLRTATVQVMSFQEAGEL